MIMMVTMMIIIMVMMIIDNDGNSNSSFVKFIIDIITLQYHNYFDIKNYVHFKLQPKDIHSNPHLNFQGVLEPLSSGSGVASEGQLDDNLFAFLELCHIHESWRDIYLRGA